MNKYIYEHNIYPCISMWERGAGGAYTYAKETMSGSVITKLSFGWNKNNYVARGHKILNQY